MQSARIQLGSADIVRVIRGHRDAVVLRAGGSQPLVCPRLRAGLCAGFDLRLPAGRLAVRAGRSDLGDGGAAALERQAAMTSPPLCRQDAKPSSALYWCALRRWIKSVSPRDWAGLSV